MSGVYASPLVRSVNIVDGEIVNADVAALAAIAYSKLNLAGGIVNADVNAAAAIAYSKLNLATSIATGDLANLAVTEGKLAASAVAQGKLKTTTASGSVSAVGDGTYTLTGGTYSWATWGGTTASDGTMLVFGSGNTAAGVLGFRGDGAASWTIFVDERYIQASPPYTHGPLFVFLALDASGKIIHSRIAPDPPWAYHGPTDITPQFWRGDKAYRRVKKINGLSMHAALRDPATMRALMDGGAKVTEEEVEITLAFKDSDMAVVPHPFVGNNLTGLRVVMLEPGTTLMQRLAEFCDAGEAREVRNIVLGGYLNIITTPLNIPSVPAGVVAYRATMKLTP